jgi:predicted transcriptional regulator
MTKQHVKPTDAELDVLQALWQHGPGTVKEIQQRLPDKPHRGYTTVLKLLQIMAEKGLVLRDEAQRAHIYRADLSLSQTQKNLLSHLMDKVFDKSAGSLVVQALSTRKASREELAEIRKLLDQMEGDTK